MPIVRSFKMKQVLLKFCTEKGVIPINDINKTVKILFIPLCTIHIDEKFIKKENIFFKKFYNATLLFTI